MRKKNRVIRTAYEAYWFLNNHPKMSVPDRVEITAAEADEMEKANFLLSRDAGGRCYRYFRHVRRKALDCNLDIFYTKVNKPRGGRRVRDESKNKYVECWLEFGQLKYGYSYSGDAKPLNQDDTETRLLEVHDYHLDTGAPTFDEAHARARGVLWAQIG